jgi:uncharacterized protein (TIRG00374 family)
LKRHHFVKGIGLALLAIILIQVDLGQVVQLLRNCQYGYLLLVVLLIFPQIGLRALRWQRLLAQQGIQCSLRSAAIFYFAAIYAGLITPGRMGELVKCYFLKQNGMAGLSQSLPSVLVDRALDLYFLGLVAWAALYHADLLPIPLWAAFLTMAGLGILPWIILKWKGKDQPLISRIGIWLSNRNSRWGESWRVFLHASRSLLSSRLLGSLFLTALSYAVYFGQTYLIGLSIGLPMDYITVAMVVSIGILVGYIPITFAGLGTRDAALIFLFGRYGIPAASALSFAFLYNLVYIVFVGMISVVFWMRLPNRRELKLTKKT